MQPGGLYVSTSARSMWIESVEVTGDNRHRYGQRQYTYQRAHRANNTPDRSNRNFITVSYRCHGDDGPPDRVRYAMDLRAGRPELGVIYGTGEN